MTTELSSLDRGLIEIGAPVSGAPVSAGNGRLLPEFSGELVGLGRSI
jgi:hypothetical protein